ncbi:cystathionine beta-synthase [Ceratobasidium sp. AG-Ba]|nr:cystathionine beta-synthase [Ceratobasidium sp. AG-Ba]
MATTAAPLATLSAAQGSHSQSQARSISLLSTGPSKYRGAVVEVGRSRHNPLEQDLQLPPAFALSEHERVEKAVQLAYDRDFSYIPVLDTRRKPVGYIDVGRLKSKWEAGTANPSDTLGNFMAHFKRGTAVPYTVITPETSLEELEEFLEKNDFAIVTDPDRKFVLALATKDDLTNFVTRRGA